MKWPGGGNREDATPHSGESRGKAKNVMIGAIM